MKTQGMIVCLAVLWSGMAVLKAEAPTGILSNIGKFRPQISVADSYSDRLVRVLVNPATPADPDTDTPATPAEYEYQVVPQAQKVSAKAVGYLADQTGTPLLDFASIGEETEVGLNAGEFSFSGQIGDADAKRLGSTGSATFYFTQIEVVRDSRGNPKLDSEGMEITRSRRIGSLVFSWSSRSKTGTATLAGVIPAGSRSGEDIAGPEGSGLNGIAAIPFAGIVGESGGTRAFANETVKVALKFGSLTGTRTAFVAGKTVTKLSRVRVDPQDPSMDEYYPVTTVTVAGAADVKGPSLSVQVPARANAATGEAAVFATVTDRPLPVLGDIFRALGPAPLTYGYDGEAPRVTVSVNGSGSELGYVDSAGNPVEEGSLDSRGRGRLSGVLGADALTSLKNTVVFEATDSEGNTTRVVKSIAATPALAE